MLVVDHWPALESPVMVVALAGWVDAGAAGSGAIGVLRDRLIDTDGDEFARIELADVMDLQQTRPVARWATPDERVIDWPEITFLAGRLGRDVVIVSGPEPSLRWTEVSGLVVDVAQRLGVVEAFTLAGMPAIASHRRPVTVLASAAQRSFAQELAPLRGDYAGPTGLQTVVQRALGDAGLRAAGLWAQVPQYVAGSPSPPSVRALLARLAEVARIDLDLRFYDRKCADYIERVDAGLASRPDVAEVVDRIDRAQAAESEDLVSEIEQFLRSRGDDA
ncbi:MAG: PAC2 family protein [Actinomycetota bacterium]